jgi:hypothetical protein
MLKRAIVGLSLAVAFAPAALSGFSRWEAAFSFFAHCFALAPGLLLIVVAISLTDGEDRASRGIRVALAAVMVLSAAQILRSVSLYLTAS